MPSTLDEIEDALQRQDSALSLLEQLRSAHTRNTKLVPTPSSGRRDFRRWPTPETVTIELHNGKCWSAVETVDIGIGGARVIDIPSWMEGPAPVRLRCAQLPDILALADIMWRELSDAEGGIRFEFMDLEERDLWTSYLIDSLLANIAA